MIFQWTEEELRQAEQASISIVGHIHAIAPVLGFDGRAHLAALALSAALGLFRDGTGSGPRNEGDFEGTISDGIELSQKMLKSESV